MTRTDVPDGLSRALRQAREMEAAHRAAVLAFADAKALRLGVLMDEIQSAIVAAPEAQAAFDIALSKDLPPRLFLDLITSVVMEPDPKTYRLMVDGATGPQVLFESGSRAAMLQQVKAVLASRLIEQRRRQVAPPRVESGEPGYSSASLMLAWMAGFALGALALLSAAIYLKLLHF